MIRRAQQGGIVLGATAAAILLVAGPALAAGGSYSSAVSGGSGSGSVTITSNGFSASGRTGDSSCSNGNTYTRVSVDRPGADVFYSFNSDVCGGTKNYSGSASWGLYDRGVKVEICARSTGTCSNPTYFAR